MEKDGVQKDDNFMEEPSSYMLCAQTGGWVDICNIVAFYHEKASMFALSQPTTVLHTNNPAKFLLSMHKNSSYG